MNGGKFFILWPNLDAVPTSSVIDKFGLVVQVGRIAIIAKKWKKKEDLARTEFTRLQLEHPLTVNLDLTTFIITLENKPAFYLVIKPR